MRNEYPEQSTIEHLLDLLLIGTFLTVGVVICALLLYPVLLYHERWMRLYGRRWYDRED